MWGRHLGAATTAHRLTAHAADTAVSSSYERATDGLIAYFRARGVSTEDAKDLAHETVLRALVHLRRHGPSSDDLGPLMRSIGRNLLIERWRKPSPRLSPLSEAHEIRDPAPEPGDHAVDAERRAAINEALRTLVPRHRRVIHLWMQGLSSAEIGRELGIKRNAVDALLHRARRSLASRLGPSSAWGAIAVVFLRSRGAARRAARSVASWAPSSTSAAPAGVSVATVCLCAAVTLLAPQHAPAAGDQRPAAATSGLVAAAEAVQTPAEIAQAAVGGPITQAPGVRGPAGTYSIGTGTTVSNPATGEADDIGLDVEYDPQQNGRGAIDEFVEPALEAACGPVRTCTKGR